MDIVHDESMECVFTLDHVLSLGDSSSASRSRRSLGGHLS